MGICSLPGCDRTSKARGMCQLHYHRFRAHGDPLKAPASQDFWGHVEKTDSCWIWKKQIGVRGYGRVSFNGTQTGAHRAAYELTYGEIPKGLFVCHHCDNRNCVRPSHLFLGTPMDNMRDMIRKGRQRPASKLTREQVLAIASLKDKGKLARDVASIFAVSASTISLLWNGYTWARVTGIQRDRQ